MNREEKYEALIETGTRIIREKIASDPRVVLSTETEEGHIAMLQHAGGIFEVVMYRAGVNKSQLTPALFKEHDFFESEEEALECAAQVEEMGGYVQFGTVMKMQKSGLKIIRRKKGGYTASRDAMALMALNNLVSELERTKPEKSIERPKRKSTPRLISSTRIS